MHQHQTCMSNFSLKTTSIKGDSYEELNNIVFHLFI